MQKRVRNLDDFEKDVLRSIGFKYIKTNNELNEMGHLVIRLPPYHCLCNPIELIWAKVKGEFAQLNNTFGLSDVERLMNEAIDRVIKGDWISRVRHAEQLQEEDFHKEIARDELIQPSLQM
jgi:hypothetical protein